MPPKFCPPLQLQKLFLHFRPTLSPYIFGLKLLRLLKLKIFTVDFPTNFRYGFEFLIPFLNFELQTFKTARFFKNTLFYPFFEGIYLTSRILEPHQTCNAP